MARAAIRGRARTRPNPERALYTRDILEQIDPQATEPWLEGWEAAREAGVDDVRLELLEGAQSFAQKFADGMLEAVPYLEPAEQEALVSWFATAPAALRPGGPLDRGDQDAAAAEAASNYNQMVERLFLAEAPADRDALQAAMRTPARSRFALNLWSQALAWTAQAMDRGVAETAEALWAFPPFQQSLAETMIESQIAEGPELLHDELQARILEGQPITMGGDPVAALEELLER